MDQREYSNCSWCGEFLAILAPTPNDVKNDNFDLCDDCGQYPKRGEMLREYQKELKKRKWEDFRENIRLGVFSIAVLGGFYMMVIIFWLGMENLESPF